MLGDLKDAGYWVAALTPGGETSIYELDTDAAARNRGRLGRPRRARADREDRGFPGHDPDAREVDSLNVSVATAIALFEIARRRISVNLNDRRDAGPASDNALFS